MYTVPSFSMESVSFQQNYDFMKDLTRVYSKYTPDSDLDTMAKEVGKIITKHTNIFVEVSFSPGNEFMIYTPIVDVNHIFLKVQETIGANNSARYALARNQDNPIGWLDYKTGKVHGIFTDLKHTLIIGQKNFDIFPPDEMATTTLHEVGHAISKFSELSVDVIRGLGAMTLVRDLMLIEGEEIINRRIQLVKQFTKESGIIINRPNQMVKYDKAVDAIVELNRDITLSYRSETGNDLTDIRIWETMADQYVVRMGGGANFAKVIHKLDKLHPHRRQNIIGWENFSLGFYGLLFSILFTSVVPITLGLTWIALRSADHNIIPKRDVYHGPAERIRKLRQEMIFQLRLNQYADKDGLIKQIDDLEKLAKDSYDDIKLSKESLFWFMTSSDRKQYINNTELDSIGRNDLFVQAAKLTT